MKSLSTLIFSLVVVYSVSAQKDPKTTEIWDPEPEVVTPGKIIGDPPSDAIILFDGSNANEWAHMNGDPVKWDISGNVMTVVKGTGLIASKKKFSDVQLHIEWRTPTELEGEGQGRSNSGVFFMERYEIQVLDSYENRTYSNGQASSVYKQHSPLVNAMRPPGEWQVYDIIFNAPRFSESGKLMEPARVTVFHNGVLTQNNVTVWGPTEYIGLPTYETHGPGSIMLQDHSNPVSFRNIWVRPLD